MARRGKSAWWLDYIILGLYLLLALAFTWPVLSTATTAIIGDGKDGWQDTWEIWWMNRAMSTGVMPYHFATLYAPDGVTNFLHSLNPVEIWLALPAFWASGAILAFNVACWTALVLTAFGGYLLARDLTGSRASGFVGGLAIGFAPHQFGQLLSHMDVAAIQFFVLGVWTFYRSLSSEGRRSVVWALWSAACVTAAVLSHPYTWISLIIVMAILAIGWPAFGSRRQWWRSLTKFALAIAVGLLVASPLLLAMARTASGPNAPGQGESTPSEVLTYSADLVAFAIPSPFSPLWGAAASDALRPLKGTLVEKVVFPGYIVLALALIGAVARATRRRATLWWIIALAGFALSLGPSLQIGGRDTAIPLPAAIFYALPGSSILRVPARFDIITMLGLGMCAALGVSALLHARPATFRVRRAGYALVVLLLGIELLPAPYRTSAFNVNPWYFSLAGQAQSGAVLEVPFDRLDARPEESQIASGVQLAGGYLSRQPVYPLSRGVPPFVQFGLNKLPGAPLPGGGSLCAPEPDRSSFVDILRLANVRYVAVHLDRLKAGDPRVGLAKSLFPGGPTYSDNSLLVFDTGGGAAPASLLGATEDTDDWGPVEGGKFRWTGYNYARIYVWSGAPRQITMRLRLASFAQTRDVEVLGNGQQLATGSIGSNGGAFDLSWAIPRGFSTLLIHASGPPVSPASLGLGSDARPLTFNLSECSYSGK